MNWNFVLWFSTRYVSWASNTWNILQKNKKYSFKLRACFLCSHTEFCAHFAKFFQLDLELFSDFFEVHKFRIACYIIKQVFSRCFNWAHCSIKFFLLMKMFSTVPLIKPQQLFRGWTASVNSCNQCVESHGWLKFVSKYPCVSKIWVSITEAMWQSSASCRSNESKYQVTKSTWIAIPSQ